MDIQKVVLQKSLKDVTFSQVIFWNDFGGKLHPKVKMYCDCTDSLYDPYIDDNCFYIYNLPLDDIRLKLRDKSDRYRLYGIDTKPVDVQNTDKNGRIKWVRHYPYIYKTVNKVKDVNAENHEYETVIEWIELTPENKAKIMFEQDQKDECVKKK